ncbi:hypothetical protein GQ600_16208 [Phytophthora cactorum]|nr:hypothetical protein GQ600_16208 [Phytophthora cactorum]
MFGVVAIKNRAFTPLWKLSIWRIVQIFTAVRVDEAVRSRRDDSGNAAVQRGDTGFVATHASTSTFSLQKFQDQLVDKLTLSSLVSGHSDALVCFWPGSDPRGVIWKGFLMPRDPSHPWRMDSQTQALNFINSGLYALTTETRHLSLSKS